MITADLIQGLLGLPGPVAAAVVVGSRGSTPRDSGAIMVILDDSVLGTIGGGRVEHEVTIAAREMLLTGGDPRISTFALGPDIDQCCGGSMTVAIGPVRRWWKAEDPLWQDGPHLPVQRSERQVIIYGAGHVGTALAQCLAPLPFSVTLVESKACEDMSQDHPVIRTPLPEVVVEEASDQAFHVVLTHSHAQDLEIVSAILGRRFAFCGLIGSRTKRATFSRRLSERGIPDAAIDRMTCPIGLDGLRDKRPEVIAASVAAQLLILNGDVPEPQRKPS